MSRVEYPRRIEIACDCCGKGGLRGAVAVSMRVPQEDFSGSFIAESKCDFDLCRECASALREKVNAEVERIRAALEEK